MFGLFTYLGCRYLLINVAKFSDKKEWVVTYNRADDFKCKLALFAQKGSRYRNLKNFTWIFSLFCQICDIMSPCKHFITHKSTNEFSWKSKPFKTKIGVILWKMSPSNISEHFFILRITGYGLLNPYRCTPDITHESGPCRTHDQTRLNNHYILRVLQLMDIWLHPDKPHYCPLDDEWKVSITHHCNSINDQLCFEIIFGSVQY